MLGKTQRIGCEIYIFFPLLDANSNLAQRPSNQMFSSKKAACDALPITVFLVLVQFPIGKFCNWILSWHSSAQKSSTEWMWKLNLRCYRFSQKWDNIWRWSMSNGRQYSVTVGKPLMSSQSLDTLVGECSGICVVAAACDITILATGLNSPDLAIQYFHSTTVQ